ncbi:DUF6069 family protein [Rothia dentocariosa]
MKVPVRIALAAAGSALGNLAVYFGAQALGASMQVQNAPYPITAAVVAGASIVPIALGAGIAQSIGTRKPGFLKFARIAGTSVAALTFISPLLTASDTTTGLGLAAMHFIGAGAWYFAASSPARSALPNS